MKRSKSSWTQRAQAFWDARQRLAAPGALTGYLQDESPLCIGQRRFDGEWVQVKTWIDQRGLARGRCLDLGCGTGIWLKALAQEFKQVEGWDFAPAMIKASRQTFKDAGLRAPTLKIGQIKRRQERHVFDLIFVGGVLMYTPDAELGPMLKALARLLKPGGLLILRESTCRGETWLREGAPLRRGFLAKAGSTKEVDYVAVYRSVKTLTRWVADAGFKVAAIEANRNYKLSDMTEDWLRRFDLLLLGKVRKNAQVTESLARWIYRFRFLLLYPEYILRHYLGLWPWKLDNHWFLLNLVDVE